MAYEYVKSYYGVRPVIGRRVRLENSDRFGVITRRRAYDHRVWVRFDGQSFASPCHPTSLDYDTPQIFKGGGGSDEPSRRHIRGNAAFGPTTRRHGQGHGR